MIVVRLVYHLLIIIFLTLLTQIGGLAYGLYLIITLFLRQLSSNKLRRFLTFLALYLGLSTAAVFIAPHFGREPLPCFGSITGKNLSMQSPLYCALNRHYVKPKLKRLALTLADYMDSQHPGTVTLALDANFPFGDGFPLLPHLSHDDGQKLDLALYFQGEGGHYSAGATSSPIGYWGFVKPLKGKDTTCSKRKTALSLRWDMDWFQPFVRDLELDQKRTTTALRWLKGEGRKRGLSKILLEPHLAASLGVSGGIVRFQGCRAARHDDHIHIQM